MQVNCFPPRITKDNWCVDVGRLSSTSKASSRYSWPKSGALPLSVLGQAMDLPPLQLSLWPSLTVCLMQRSEIDLGIGVPGLLASIISTQTIFIYTPNPQGVWILKNTNERQNDDNFTSPNLENILNEMSKCLPYFKVGVPFSVGQLICTLCLCALANSQRDAISLEITGIDNCFSASL